MVTFRGQGVFFGKTDGCIGCRGSKAFKNDPSGINSEIRNLKKNHWSGNSAQKNIYGQILCSMGFSRTVYSEESPKKLTLLSPL